MMRRETPFVTHDDLMFVQGRVAGPKGTTIVRLVIDTGASYTTITPEVARDIGYSVRDRIRPTRVESAIGSERGYVLKLARLSTLGVVASSPLVHVFDLRHDDIDGLVGMNFLQQLNYEVRSAERRILVEPVAQSSA